jgi:flagella synthesis protein FlgN
MNPVESLLACLKQEDALITEFATVLQAETDVLIQRGEIDILQSITDRKAELAQELVARSSTRDALLTELGFGTGHAGTELAAQAHPQLSSTWQALLSSSASANEINTRNGALIDVHLRYTQQSLDALRNIAGLGAPSTYTAQGRGARATPGRRPIVAG